MSYTIDKSTARRWALWNNLLRINVYLGLWVLGRNDPKVGADRPSSWGGSTAFGADVGGSTRGGSTLGRIDRYPVQTEVTEDRNEFTLLSLVLCLDRNDWSHFGLKPNPIKTVSCFIVSHLHDGSLTVQHSGCYGRKRELNVQILLNGKRLKHDLYHLCILAWLLTAVTAPRCTKNI